MVDIKILGSGCANCKRMEAMAHEVVAAMGIEATFEKVTDRAKILEYPIIATPGLVINGEVVSSGRIPPKSEIEGWLQKAA
jgi:small redox-active disulfide protein 2